MISSSESAIEAELKTKGLNAPRLTPQSINDTITDAYYHRIPGTTVTVCALTLKNGYIVVGKSAAASAENFDQEIGQRIAYDDARNQIWALEGYLLRQQLSTQA